MLLTINKDILDFDGYICHQCNCLTTSAKGLAYHIFKKYPDANIYNDETVREMGNIYVRSNIINMCAQINPGKSKIQKDSNEVRLVAFKKCLNKMLDIDSDVAFPFQIGCGLAGGEWSSYYDLIEEFSKLVTFNVYICKL